MAIAIGFDVSSYQSHVPAGNWDFGIAKNDNWAERHIKSMQDRGIPYTGLYQWVDPLLSIPTQIDNLITRARKWNVSFLWNDDEQWWSDWVKYMGTLSHTYAGTVPQLTAAHISGDFLQAAQLAKASGLPFANYTAQWVTRYAPQMATWLGDYDLANACYFDRNVSSVYHVSWEQLVTIANNLDNLGVLSGVLSKTDVKSKIVNSNILVPGQPKQTFRQFSDHIILPGETEVMDLDIFNGDMSAWIGGVAPAPAPLPPPTIPTFPQYKLNSWTWVLTIRQGPGTNYPIVVGAIADQYLTKLSPPVTAYATQNGWVKISQTQERWCGLSGLSLVTKG
jgi:hypothetical protein